MRGEDGRVGQSFNSLPPNQRARRYRELADAALAHLKNVKTPEHRAEYLNLAAGWHALAQDIEANLNSLAQLEISQEHLQKASRQKPPLKGRPAH